VVGVSKNRVSATVDDDVYEFLQQDHINMSGLINRCIREYMNTGGDVSAVRDLRIQQLEDEAEDLKSRAENKREKANRLREQIEASNESDREERLNEVVSSAGMIPADPSHPFVQQHSDELDMTTDELAKAIADAHGKDLQTNTDDDLNSL